MARRHVRDTLMARQLIKPASEEQQAALFQLHIDVYGYVTAETAAQISAYSRMRAAQETANLMRAFAAKQELHSARAELKELHRQAFYPESRQGQFQEKSKEIDAMDLRRVLDETATIRRMLGVLNP